jgi:hypothetical protein
VVFNESNPFCLPRWKNPNPTSSKANTLYRNPKLPPQQTAGRFVKTRYFIETPDSIHSPQLAARVSSDEPRLLLLVPVEADEQHKGPPPREHAEEKQHEDAEAVVANVVVGPLEGRAPGKEPDSGVPGRCEEMT